MRNLGEKWTAVPDWTEAAITIPGLDIRSLSGLSQYLVSGDLEAWSRRSGVSATGVGAFGRADGSRYAVQVARGRLLVVCAAGLGIAPGWHDEGFGVTVISAGLHVFQAEGPAVPALIARATPIDPGARSASAALTFGGVDAIVYRRGEGLRLHVERSLAPYLWSWMEAAARSQKAQATSA